MRVFITLVATVSLFCAVAAYAAPDLPGGVKREGGALTTASGQPLYTFDWDTMKGMSHCLGECLTTRRPLTATPGSKAQGDWSVIGREDGTLQWAYKDKPLYTFKGDAPGAPPKGVEEGRWALAK